MDSIKDNEILTRVGPGTPMGNLMRRYWLPALKSSELIADGDPVRLKLLSEKLIAFRDTDGRVGVMDHRFKHKVKAKAYKASERNGVVWVYMGEAATAPALPEIPATLIPEEEASISFVMRSCNWLQGMEGDIDTSHLNFLHYGSMGEDAFEPNDASRYGAIHKDPEYKVADTDLGTFYGAYRPADPGMTYWRDRPFHVPVLGVGPLHPVRALPHCPRLGAARRYPHDVRVHRTQVRPRRGPWH